MPTKEDIEKSRADRRAKQDEARDEQELADLVAIDALEAESGEPLHTMTANSFKVGVPVKIAFRSPTATEYKRYKGQVNRAGKERPDERVAAQELLAEVCLVYPPAGDVRKALHESSPGTLISLAIEAAKAAELRAEEEGK